MERERIVKPANTWVGATILSLLTGVALGYGVFLVLLSGTLPGLIFIVIAIAFACLSWFALPKDRKLQLWATGLSIALALTFFVSVISHLTPRVM
jgi:hypothetical protein